MSGNALAFLRENARRVYVIFTPSTLFNVKLDAPSEHARIAKEIAAGRFESHFSDSRFVKYPLQEVFADPELCEAFKSEYLLLQNNYFGSVWFYGDSTTEFTRTMAYLAVRHRVRVINFADKGSLLDRFLRLWISRHNTLS